MFLSQNSKIFSSKLYISLLFKKYQILTIVIVIGTIFSVVAFRTITKINLEKLEENFRSDAKVKTLFLEKSN